jgi:hypothetical protein
MRPALRTGLVLAVAFSIALPGHATLVTWYDATTLAGYSDGAEVGSLADLSGAGNDAATAITAGSYLADGIGGQAAIRFDAGVSGYKGALTAGGIGISGDAPWSMSLVFNAALGGSSPNQHVMVLGDGSIANTCVAVEFDDLPLWPRLDIASGYYNDVGLYPGFSAFGGEDLILTCVHTGGGPMTATTQLYINGYAAGDGILDGYVMGFTGNADTTPFNIAGYGWLTLGYGLGPSGAQTDGFSGLLSEFRLYNSALSDGERQQMTDELGDKYDIDTKDVPEPGTAALFGLGLGALVLGRRRRKAA